MKAKTFFISVLVFVGISAVAIGAMVYFSTNRNSTNSGQNNNVVTITLAEVESSVVGYIYTSGLTSGPVYQLTYITKSASVITPLSFTQDLEGVFLQGDQTALAQYWGKCVQVIGTMGADINTKSLSENYYRANMTVQSVSPSTECVISLGNYPEYEQIIKTYSGRIEKNIRPMPDVDYDFKLILTTPYQDTNNPSGIETTVTEITIVPLTGEVFNMLNNGINETVTVTGEWTTGFAESEFLLVSSIN